MTRSQYSALIISITAIATLLSAPTAVAQCFFTDKNSKELTLNFGAGIDQLSIPQDAPIGSVIYTQTINTPEQYYTCQDNVAMFGLVSDPSRGTPSGTIFPLGSSGLSFRIATIETGLPYLPIPFKIPPSRYRSGSPYYTLEIIKSSQISSETPIPGGLLGTLQADEVVLFRFNILNSIKLNTASCESPAVSVQMGDDYRIVEFEKAGDAPRMVRFNIGLNQCQSGIKKITYSLKASTQVIDAKKGMVALDSTSTAKGIGLKLMDETGEPIALDTTYSYNGFNTSDSSFNIPLAAAYYRLADGNVEAGLANSSVTFIINYL